MAETNKNFRLVVENKQDLAGLPEDVITAAAEQAKKDGQEGKWSFTLQKPSLLPFLSYADSRELREKLYRGYFMRGNNNNENDNKTVVNKFANLRLNKAKLLGYADFASYVIAENMAKTPDAAYNFLKQVWAPALETSKSDLKEMQAIIDAEGGKFELASWDWWYYAEKLRKAKYDLDESETKPYFTLENVINGYMYVANKLYGLTFKKIEGIPTYHKDAYAYEVKNADGSHLGVYYMDFYPRDGKRSGAWSTNYRSRYYDAAVN